MAANPDAEGMANASLFLAAPDLLAACKAMLADKDAVQTDQQACRRLYNAWLDMRDAVNRAEGRDA